MSSPSAFIDFARAVREADVNFMLTGRGQPEWRVQNGLCGDIVIQHGRCGAGMVADGVMAQPDVAVFVLQSSLERHAVSLNGIPVARHGIAVLPPGSPFIFTNAVPHSWISVTLPLAALSPAQLGRLDGRIECGQASLIEADAGAFGRILDAVATAPLGTEAAARPDRAYAAASAVREALVGSTTPNGGPIENATSRHHVFVRRALTGLPDDAGPTPPLVDLCTVAGVCERTLRRAFCTVFGMPPARYLKLRQLNRVHAALLDPAARGRLVTDVLTSHGITELGRFAMNYRGLFGELPSQTMRRLDEAHR